VIKSVTYNGITDCFSLSNGTVEAVIATSFGPRIIGYAFDDGDNVLGWHPKAKVETELGTWRPHGGHRSWLAPEKMPLSYAPDDEAVEVETFGDLSVVLRGPIDAAGVRKEMTIALDATGSELTIDHRLTVSEPCEASAWALTIMRPGGTIIIPNEPFARYSPEHLLPVRSIALWSYTDFTDPRWSFENDTIRLRVDESRDSQQKLGVLNKQGWTAYEMNNVVFTKRSAFDDQAVYPDMNSNFEFYTAGGFVEIETLSPLKKLAAGESIEHGEAWSLEMLS
jgi:hypothetical protein